MTNHLTEAQERERFIRRQLCAYQHSLPQGSKEWFDVGAAILDFDGMRSKADATNLAEKHDASTTPQPVQEPAGAVEALRLADKLKTWIDLNVGRAAEATILAEDVSRLAALASLPPVTQAKSEAVVAWVNLLPGWDDAARRVFTDRKAAADYHEHCYDLTPLYAAPQEAVERQPLTPAPSQYIRAHQYLRRREADIGAGELDELLAIFGIGPATQEKA